MGERLEGQVRLVAAPGLLTYADGVVHDVVGDVEVGCSDDAYSRGEAVVERVTMYEGRPAHTEHSSRVAAPATFV